jgi:hypothetical protein
VNNAGLFRSGVCMPQVVEIVQADDGSYQVGLVDAPSSDADDMQAAGSLNEALSMAKHLLSNPPADGDADDSGAGSDQSSGAAGGAGAPSGGSPDAGNASSGADASAGGAGGAAGSGQSAQSIWDELAAQGQPAH